MNKHRGGCEQKAHCYRARDAVNPIDDKMEVTLGVPLVLYIRIHRFNGFERIFGWLGGTKDIAVGVTQLDFYERNLNT